MAGDFWLKGKCPTCGRCLDCGGHSEPIQIWHGGHYGQYQCEQCGVWTAFGQFHACIIPSTTTGAVNT